MSKQIIKGPCIMYGQALSNLNVRTKAEVTITKRVESIRIDTDGVKGISNRLVDNIHEISFTPAGTSADLDLLVAAASFYPGKKILENVSATISGVADAGGGNCTLTFSASKTVYAGQYIWIKSSSVSAYNGARRVTADSTGTTATVVMTYSATATATALIPPCLIIHPLFEAAESEKILIYQNAGVTALPALSLAANEPSAFGSMTISAICHPFLEPADADAFVRRATWAAPGSTRLDDYEGEHSITDAPRLRFGPADAGEFTSGDALYQTWPADFRTRAGLKINFSLTLDADRTDKNGTVNWTVQDVGLVATCTPVSGQPNIEISDTEIDAVLKLQDNGSDGLAVGMPLNPGTPNELLIRLTNIETDIRIPSVAVTAAQSAFGSNAARNGDVAFTAVRTMTSGSANALWTIEEVG